MGQHHYSRQSLRKECAFCGAHYLTVHLEADCRLAQDYRRLFTAALADTPAALTLEDLRAVAWSRWFYFSVLRRYVATVRDKAQREDIAESSFGMTLQEMEAVLGAGVQRLFGATLGAAQWLLRRLRYDPDEKKTQQRLERIDRVMDAADRAAAAPASFEQATRLRSLPVLAIGIIFLSGVIADICSWPALSVFFVVITTLLLLLYAIIFFGCGWDAIFSVFLLRDAARNCVERERSSAETWP